MTHTPRSDDEAGWTEESGRFAIDPETGIAFGTFTGTLRPADLLTAIATTAVTLLMWDIVSKPLIACFWRHARRPLSWGLFKLAVALKP